MFTGERTGTNGMRTPDAGSVGVGVGVSVTWDLGSRREDCGLQDRWGCCWEDKKEESGEDVDERHKHGTRVLGLVG